MLCTVKWVKKVYCGGVFDLAVEQPQLFRKLPKNKTKTIRQVPQPRNRLILRGSCPRSRLGHTSDIHSHSYNRCQCSHPAANITDIFCWACLHLKFFLGVNVLSDNWPSSARRCSDESSPLPGQCCTCVTVWCSGLAVLCVVMSLLVWPFTLNHAGTITVHTRLGTSISVTSWPAHLGIVFPVCI